MRIMLNELFLICFRGSRRRVLHPHGVYQDRRCDQRSNRQDQEHAGGEVGPRLRISALSTSASQGKARTGNVNWGKQFKDAVFDVYGDDDEDEAWHRRRSEVCTEPG